MTKDKDVGLIIEYDGPVWMDKIKNEYHDDFKIAVISLYKSLKNYSKTARIVNNTFKSENLVIRPSNIKKWSLDIKKTKSHVIDRIEEEEGIVKSVYKQIHDKAIEETKTVVDLIPDRTDEMDAFGLSKTAMNLVNVAEKMDTIDPDNKIQISNSEFVLQMTKEEKISFILRYKKMLPDDIKNQIDKVMSSHENKNDNEIIEAEESTDG